MPASRLEALASYNACDISDALLKLHVPGAGYLADIRPISHPQPPPQQAQQQPPSYPSSEKPPSGYQDPSYPQSHQQQPSASSQSHSHASKPKKLIARASTVLFTARSSPSFPTETSATGSITGIIKSTFSLPSPNIPEGTPFSDLTIPETIVVVSQPVGQVCAVVGGIHAVRMKVLGAKGLLVDGRVRDLGTLKELGLPVWSKGTSCVGAGAESEAWATEVPVSIGSAVVHPGDIIILDPSENGAVCIPADTLNEVLDLLPKLTRADEKVIMDVGAGVSVKEAFKKYRGNDEVAGSESSALWYVGTGASLAALYMSD